MSLIESELAHPILKLETIWLRFTINLN
jgi:hypothetical protein